MLDLDSVKLKFLMNGEGKFDNPEVLAPILDILESSPLFMPEELAVGHFHFEEYQRKSAELAYETVTGYLDGKPCTASEFRLRRKKKFKYELRVFLGKKHRGMRLELSGKAIEKSWQPFLALCEQLAAAYRPDIAWVDYYIPVEEPFDSRVEELLFMMNHSSHIGNDYEEYGPCGFAVRTYLGSDFVERLGRHRLESLTASVKELSWGGIVVDLTTNPCQTSLEELTNTWEAAMDHLSPSKVFAIQMPSSIKNFSGSLEEMYGERGHYFQPYRDYQGYHFWNHNLETLKGVNLMVRGKYAEAIAEFTKILDKNSDHGEALEERSNAYYKLGKLEEAIEDLTSIIMNFEPAFDTEKWWCQVCNDYMVYEEDEYPFIDAGLKAGYWPYNVMNRGYVYNTGKGDPKRGIKRGTPFEKLPDDWVCPYCESGKEHFGDQIVQTMYASDQAEVYIRRGKLYMEKGEIGLAKQDFQTTTKIDGTRLNEVKNFI